jgi:hypothetical protein
MKIAPSAAPRFSLVHAAVAATIIAWTLIAQTASAAPITFRAKGTIANVGTINEPPVPLLDAIVGGMPWQLDVTFDPAAVGVYAGFGKAYAYNDIVSFAKLQLGPFVYSVTRGDVAVNWALPIGDGSGGPGLVQFHFTANDGWTGALGGPNLNTGLGLVVFSWNDVNAVDGALPTSPMLANQGYLSGFVWSTFPAFPNGYQDAVIYSPDVDIVRVDEVSEVPEPATLALLAAGVALLIARRQSPR